MTKVSRYIYNIYGGSTRRKKHSKCTLSSLNKNEFEKLKTELARFKETIKE